jgi:hypothetical protein
MYIYASEDNGALSKFSSSGSSSRIGTPFFDLNRRTRYPLTKPITSMMKATRTTVPTSTEVVGGSYAGAGGGDTSGTFPGGGRARTTSALEEAGFQYAEEMEEVEINPSFATRSAVRRNTTYRLEVAYRPTSKLSPSILPFHLYAGIWQATLLRTKTCFLKLPVSSCPSL